MYIAHDYIYIYEKMCYHFDKIVKLAGILIG